MSDTKSDVRIKEDVLRDYCEKILVQSGVESENAKTVVDVLLYGDMRGIQSHGVRWLNIYTKRIREGGILPNVQPEYENNQIGTISVNGGGGLGQVVMMKAIEMVMEKTKEFGIAVAGVRNSNHFGATGYYSLKAAEAGYISFICSNATPLMAPWGGMQAKLGTNPFSFGVPTGVFPPIIVDMATSAVARGKIFVAEKKGEKIPLGWAVNEEGCPTQDPAEALRGVLLPFAGPKGYGLALIVDILAGVLTGSLFGNQIPPLYDKPSEPQDIGHFIILIDIKRFMGMDQFEERIKMLINDIKETQKMEGVKEIFLPGEIEHLKCMEAKREGISIPYEIYNDLLELGKTMNLDPKEYFV